jgi:transposase
VQGTRAHILLLANRQKGDTEIAEILDVGRNTVWRTKKRYPEEGLKSALTENPRYGQPPNYTKRHDAEIISLACTKSPDGRKRWSLPLLTEELKKKEGFETINRESIRLILKKSKTKPWLRKMWCIQTIDAIFRTCMYDVLDLYEEEYDPKRPLVNLDEKPKQLLGEKRTPILLKQGSSEKYDYEYVRNGTANIFVAVEFKAGKRVTQVTKRRTMKDFARFVRMFVDEEYPGVELVRLVTDNLNTHKEKAFYEAFSKDEAEKILSKIEFHYTPTHASWLNAAEIEITVMDIECTGRRIGDLETLAREVTAWTKRRNEQKKKINWKFTREKANKKLSKHYVP